MLLNDVEPGAVPRPTSRRELREAATQLSSAPSVSRTESRPHQLAAPWHRDRPLIGGILLVLGGIEIFFSGRLDFGQFRVRLGIDALPTIVVPVLLIVLGVAAVLLPRLHVALGILALVASLSSLVAVNLGGFLLGMIISSIGGVLVVAWMRPTARTDEGSGESRSERRIGRKP